MTSVNDWARKAAEEIVSIDAHCHCSVINEEQVIAIIATFAEPLMQVLREAEREHVMHACGSRYSVKGEQQPCTCGAEAWNARVRAALAGEKP